MLALAGGALWLGAGTALVLPPADDIPRRADAAAVLAGGKPERLDEGLRLMEAGVAPVLLISDGDDPDWPRPTVSAAARAACGSSASIRGPTARAARRGTSPASRLGGTGGAWSSSRRATSAFRARIIFRRCFDGDLTVVGGSSRAIVVATAIVEEPPKLALALTLRRSC